MPGCCRVSTQCRTEGCWICYGHRHTIGTTGTTGHHGTGGDIQSPLLLYLIFTHFMWTNYHWGYVICLSKLIKIFWQILLKYFSSHNFPQCSVLGGAHSKSHSINDDFKMFQGYKNYIETSQILHLCSGSVYVILLILKT